MSERSDHPGTAESEPPIRFHAFRMPLSIGWRGAGLVFAAWAVGNASTCVMLPLSGTFAAVLGTKNDWEMLAFLFGAIAGIACAGWSAWYLVRRARYETPRHRQRRLHSLERLPDFGRRFPHRTAERQVRRLFVFVRKSRKRREPGVTRHVLCVNWVLSEAMRREVQGPRHFEPIEVSDREAMMHLIQTSPEACEEAAAEGSSSKASSGRSRRRIPGWLRVGAAWLGTAIWVGMLIHGAYVQRESSSLVLLALLCVGPLLAQFMHDRWWLVPGGLVLEHYRAYRRRTRIERFTPADASLVIATSPKPAYHRAELLVGPHRRIVLTGPWTYPVLLAWLSTAPPPTDEQLIDFFAGRGEPPELVR